MPVFVLAGDEEFLLSRRVADLKKELVDPSWAAFNLAQFSNPALSEIVDACSTVPMGPGKRLVIFDGCDLFSKKRGRAQGAEAELSSRGAVSDKLLEQFDLALSSVAQDTYLVLASPYNFDQSLKLSKIVAKHAELELFCREKYYPGKYHQKLYSWCQREAKRFGATIESEAVGYLLDSTEADLRQVSGEIEKSAVFMLPKTHITHQAVTALSDFHSHVFLFVDSWIQGNREQALSSLEEMLSRQSALRLIAAVQTTLSRWIHVKAVSDKIESTLKSGRGIQRSTLPLSDLARRIAQETQGKPFLIEKDLQRVHGLQSDWLRQKQSLLCELEHRVKTGRLPENQALVLFVTSG